MTKLQLILVCIGTIIGILIIGGVQGFWSDRGLLALIVSFVAIVGGLWATAYATRNEVER